MMQWNLKWFAVAQVVNLILCINGMAIPIDTRTGPKAEARSPSLPANHLWKRSPVHSETKISNKSDHHRKLSLRLPQGGIKKGRLIDHDRKQGKWSVREQILFNEDHEGMLEEARRQGTKMALSSHNLKTREKARQNAEFWQTKAVKAIRKIPQYEKHKEALSSTLSGQEWNRDILDNDQVGAAKYRARLDVLHGGDIDKMKALEKEAHIKSLKAQQMVRDWHKLAPTELPRYVRPALFEFATTNKLGIKKTHHRNPVSQVTEAIEAQSAEMSLNSLNLNGSNESRRSALKTSKKAYIFPPGYATNAHRIGRKLQAANQRTWSKWALRAAGIKEDGDLAARIQAMTHYHNKEQTKRWNQLHWGSVRYRSERQKKAEAKRLADETE